MHTKSFVFANDEGRVLHRLDMFFTPREICLEAAARITCDQRTALVPDQLLAGGWRALLVGLLGGQVQRDDVRGGAVRLAGGATGQNRQPGPKRSV